jgi:hypothetical protein
MTDTFAHGPSAPGEATPGQAGNDVTGTLAELERKLRELERELTSIGRRRELGGEGAAPQGASEVATPTSGRLVDEALEPPAPFTPPTPLTPPTPRAPEPPTPIAPPTPAPLASLTPTPVVPSTPTPLASPTPFAAATPPTPTTPAAAPEPSDPAGPGQPVKFMRPVESARTPPGRGPAGYGEPSPGEESPDEPGAGLGPRSATGERVRPSEAQLASLAELRRFRDRLERFARDLAAEYDALLSRVMAGLTSSTPPTPASEPAYPPSASVPPVAAAAPSAAPTPLAAAPPPPEPGEGTLFEGRVELGVGPFYDIGALSAFEHRLASLPHVSEASVRRFEASHAVVDLRLAAPVALVRELRRTVDADFSVREVAEGRILLTFDEG